MNWKTVLVATLLVFRVGATQPTPVSQSIDTQDRQLFTESISPILKGSPWISNPYDSAHTLMMPMHAAFLLGERPWQKEFSDMFGRMVESGPDWHNAAPLYRLQFTFLVSRYAALAYQTGNRDTLPPKLVPWLFSEFNWWWTQAPILRSGGPAFKGERDKLAWLLVKEKTPLSYIKLWYDQDWFIQGIAANIHCIERLAPYAIKDPRVAEAMSLTTQVFKSETQSTTDGGIIFQPGVWRDYPDFAYSAYQQKGKGLRPNPSVSGSWDSSHSLRLPAIILSFVNAFPPDSQDRRFYEGIRSRLENQVRLHVFVPPTPEFKAWRAKNFMDGSNGLYRWGKMGLGPDAGFGPYELSGSITLGWWAMLGSPWIQRVYLEQTTLIPYQPNVVATYDAVTIAQTGKSAWMDPRSSTSLQRELCVRLAGQIPSGAYTSAH